jgi:hypothetical protein
MTLFDKVTAELKELTSYYSSIDLITEVEVLMKYAESVGISREELNKLWKEIYIKKMRNNKLNRIL